MRDTQDEIDRLKREILGIQKLINQSRVPHMMVKESRYIDHLNPVNKPVFCSIHRFDMDVFVSTRAKNVGGDRTALAQDVFSARVLRKR